jgi:hypothetical protein
MMGTSDPQPSMVYHINLEQFVTADHPCGRSDRRPTRTESERAASRCIRRPAGRRFPRSSCFWPSSAAICSGSRRNVPWCAS